MSTENLKEKTIFSVVWSGIQKAGGIFLNLISGIVLARLLTPHDYGVIGMLTIFLAVSNTFIDGGFGSALIQKKQPSDIDYSTIFYWNLFISIIVYIVLWIGAPIIARFYALPMLTEVLRVQSLVLVINALRIVQVNQLRKKLKFKKIAFVDLFSSFIALILTIYLAWRGLGVWALVAQQLLVSIITTLLYWLLSKWRPLFVFSKQSFKELFNFGSFMLLSNLVNTICNNIQGLLIGKIYSPSTLGVFTKARRTEELSSLFISNILDQVSYPVLSETQNDKNRMRQILQKFISTSAYLTFPLMFLLILLARPLFIFLYSERWLASVPYFQILCFSGIAISLQTINYYAVAAIGKSRVLFKWTFIKRFLGIFFIIFGVILFGINGLLFGMVLTSWTIYLINAMLVSKYVEYGMLKQCKDLFPIMLLSLFAVLIAYIEGLVLYLPQSIIAIIQGITYISVYLLASYLFRLKALNYTIDVISTIFHKIK